jgi:hypothetical protein
MTARISLNPGMLADLISAAQQEVAAAARLWNRRTLRTEPENSPHHGLDDMWLRWLSDDADYTHDGPMAWGVEEVVAMPTLQAMADQIMLAYQGSRLGGVLLTRIPPGKSCAPHTDGGWHAQTFQKFGVSIHSARDQHFCFDGVQVPTEPGDVFWFDNSQTHWVTNPTDKARVTLIVAVRTEWRPSCLGAQ